MRTLRVALTILLAVGLFAWPVTVSADDNSSLGPTESSGNGSTTVKVKGTGNTVTITTGPNGPVTPEDTPPGADPEAYKKWRQKFELCIWDATVNANVGASVAGCYTDIPGATAEGLPVAVFAWQAVAQITLPAALPLVGPDPSVNEWNMVAVGYPLWLWVEGNATVSDSTSAGGHAFSLVATRTTTSFDMGDGNTVTCAATTPYVQGHTPAAAPSPTCGYAYQKPSLPAGNYTVAAIAHWSVAWSAGGESGVIEVTTAGSRELPVGELSAVVVAGP